MFTIYAGVIIAAASSFILGYGAGTSKFRSDTLMIGMGCAALIVFGCSLLVKLGVNLVVAKQLLDIGLK